jgi:hypothetical protein
MAAAMASCSMKSFSRPCENRRNDMRRSTPISPRSHSPTVSGCCFTSVVFRRSTIDSCSGPTIRCPSFIWRLGARGARHSPQDDRDNKPIRSASRGLSWAEARLSFAGRPAPSAESKDNALVSSNHGGSWRNFREAGRGTSGRRREENIPAIPLARISTRATEAVKNNSG